MIRLIIFALVTFFHLHKTCLPLCFFASAEETASLVLFPQLKVYLGAAKIPEIGDHYDKDGK